MFGPGEVFRVESNLAAGSTLSSALTSIPLSFCFATMLLPEPKCFGFSEAASQIIGWSLAGIVYGQNLGSIWSPLNLWLPSLINENIFDNCFCSSCDYPKISPLTLQYECSNGSNGSINLLEPRSCSIITCTWYSFITCTSFSLLRAL